MPDSAGRAREPAARSAPPATLASAALVAVVALAGCAPTDEGSPTATPSTPVEPTTETTTTDIDQPVTSPSPTPSPTPDARPSTNEASTTAVRLASGPAELARRVVAAEATTRDPDTGPAELSAAAFEAQVLYRQLSNHPGWQAEVFDAVGGDLRPVVEAHVTAATRLRAMHTTLSDTLPAWRIVDPAPADELLAHHRKAEDTFGVAWEVLAAVNLVETRMGRIRGVSTAGAQGPMQFMPATWDAFGEGDVNDPHDAIMAAARYLAHNGAADGNLDRALYRYNNSDHYVTAVRAYAGIMADDPATFRAFHQWRVVYLSTAGSVWLPVGYRQDSRVPAAEYLTDNPSHLVDHDGG